MTPEELLAAARRLIERPEAATAGVWPRAAALLTRQALEQAMALLWAAEAQAADLPGCSMRSQVLCLTAYLDPPTAARTAYLWAALSRACHYHPYELAPTAAELNTWLNEAAQLISPARPAPGPRFDAQASITNAHHSRSFGIQRPPQCHQRKSS